MERGLLWLPLLLFFFWLTSLGTKEYQKLQIYQQWAQQFDLAKYDIYAVLGIKENLISWGQASPKQIINLETFCLDQIKQIYLVVDDKVITEKQLPKKGKPFIYFQLKNTENMIKIPFTEINLAAQWTQYLIEKLLNIKS